MRLGLYTFAALALIVIVGAVVYTLNPNYYPVEVMGLNLSLPIAAWVILPMLLLFFFTVLHMLIYGLKHYFLQKKWHKDTATLEDALYWSLVGEAKEQKYTLPEVASVATLLEKTTLILNDRVEGLAPRLSNIISIIEQINAGEYIDLKEKKLSKVLKEGNPLLIQNRLNQLNGDDKFVETVLRASTEYSDLVYNKALNLFSQNSDFIKASKYAKVYKSKYFFALLARVNAEEQLGLKPEIVTTFVEALDFSSEEYIEIARTTKVYFTPDENLALFKAYQEEDEKAQSAYLYLLFEYELLDQAASYLDEFEKEDFVKFRALYVLKKEHSGYRLEDIIGTSTCHSTKA